MGIVTERLPSGVGIIRFDRPERRNAMDSHTLGLVGAALAEYGADRDLRALVFSTTSTRAFSVGADTAEPLTHEQGIARMRAFGSFYAAVEAFPVPTIAVCVGNVLGAGAELAAGCDLRVVGDNLKLGWVGARLGVPVGVARLVPLVGVARAKELIFTGRQLGMEEALALGLAYHSAPAAAAEAEAIALAEQIAHHPPDGLRRLKALFRELEGAAERIATENQVLDEFQRSGPGLPQGARA